MPDESKSVGETLAKTLSTPSDYAAFLIGTAGGVLLDILSAGTSLAQGTLLGGAAALGTKKAYDAATARAQVLKECGETRDYFLQAKKSDKAAKVEELIRRAVIIKSMKAADIKSKLDAIAAGD